MAGFLTILLMSTALAVASFVVGQLPLFFTFSSDPSSIILPDDNDDLTNAKTKCCSGMGIAYLSALGTGLLLGAAMGIIIPEYGMLRTIPLINGLLMCLAEELNYS